MKSKNADKHQFYSEMAKLLEAGFGIREAAQVMSDNGLPAAQATLLDEMHRRLMDGKSIAESLGGNPQSVSNLERDIIAAGERGGSLATAMRHLADYFGMLASAGRETMKGLIHPIIVLHLGVFVGTVPTAMLGGGSAAGMLRGFFLTLFIAYAAVIAAFFGIHAMLRAARTNAGVDRLIGRVPLLGKVRSHFAMARFSKVYHTCLLAGIPMRETIGMAADASQSGMIREAAIHLQKQLAEGNPLGPAIVAEAAFPKTFARSYATGEAAGTLDTDLANWSRLFQNDAESGAKTLSAAIPKVLYFFVLCYVGWKIVGFYQNYGALLNEAE